MKASVFILSLLSVAAFEADFSSDEWKEKPIQKVIRLMTEMQTQLDKEAEADEEMYDKMGCWCDTNEKEKTSALAVNNQRVTDLTAAIEELTAKSASLSTDISELKKQVAASTTSLEESTAIREKEAGEFQAFEVDHIQNMEGLKGALMKLGKIHGDALDQQSLMQVKQILRKHFDKHRRMFSGAQKKLALIQEPVESEVDSLLQQSGEAPQSGAIFGILKQMKESMETNLKTSTDEESAAKETYASMKASKEEEISAATELIESKKAELAATDEKNAASKEDLEDTSATVAADTKFLAELKDKCDTATADYQARSKVRNEEIKAVAEAMEILQGDDARDLLLKFTQLSSMRRLSRNRDRASNLVSQLAKKMNKPKLNALAMSMRLDAFTKVKASIDEMIAELKTTQKDEVEKKDYCIKALHDNEMQTTEKTNTKADLTQLIADLETSKTTLADEIAQLKADIATSQTEMKKASEIRLAENKEFQMTIMDQKATQEILAKAVDRLKAFYAKKSLLQVKSERQPGYKKNAGASSVMTMIEHIIEESKEEEKETIAAENAAGVAYQSFVEDNSAAIEAMSKSVINKSEELAKVDSSKAEAEGNLRATEADLLSLLKTYQTLHTDCDFLLKYFDVRQTKRAEEIEALQQAKAIFSGAK
eukprot:gnl/MRDRNA2_/MRDRNA2_87576_c0_seq1.p1 gnl/MRDRNA2_/MRDRNA2_87576_c0~~gnl/MRDRNA2_/MRDRNA2_87576_c0_seq1.p1  ORF type:complete len:655 (+),score=233.85 gnl/MRDRNA2_/MRDRNA2_87576_c0_seq1:75-2039(+)